jgi:hypothetical protein
MHAVVVRVTIHDGRAAKGMLDEEIVPMVSRAPGFVAGYWTRSDEGGDGMAMIVFDSEEAANGAASGLREGPPANSEAVSLQGVDVREVVANA